MFQRKRFYLRWIWANGWSELLGLGGTLASGFVLFSWFGVGSVAATLGGAVLLVVLGALLEGALVGYAQGRVLASALHELRLRSWVAATTLGALIAWLLGMVLSTLASLGGAGERGGEFEPGLLATIGLAAGLGLVLGPILGTPQYYVLRRFVPRAVIWIGANALAWALGMVIVFLGMGLTPVFPHPGCRRPLAGRHVPDRRVGGRHRAWRVPFEASRIQAPCRLTGRVRLAGGLMTGG